LTFSKNSAEIQSSPHAEAGAQRLRAGDLISLASLGSFPRGEAFGCGSDPGTSASDKGRPAWAAF